MINRCIQICILLVLLSANLLASPGNLVIIGGGTRPPEVTRRFIDLAGGSDAIIVIFPQASGYPQEVGPELEAEFKELGVKSATYLLFDSSSVDSRQNLRSVRKASGIYFSGGDQSRLTRLMLDTRLLETIRDQHSQGVVLAGTSAGAAVMSALMITGNELKNTDPDDPFTTIAPGNIEVVTGFGFVQNAVIDQHHIARRRNNRLMSVILENPQLIGVGIDERTAIEVQPNGEWKVLGVGSVILYDARTAASIAITAQDNFSVIGMTVHILGPGQTFNPSKGTK